MDWVVDVARPGDRPPVLVADDDGVWVGYDDGAGRLVRLDTAGARGVPLGLPGPGPLAATATPDGTLHAIGEGWSTFGDVDVPDWFGEPVAILPG